MAKLILVSCPHKKDSIKAPESIKVVNIYSDADSYLDFANRMLYWGGYKHITNCENKILSGLKHTDFNKPNSYHYYLEAIIGNVK